jgi:hypothetical protein
MPEEFLLLSREERNGILNGVSQKLGRAALVLEKDVWVCCVLDAISTIPGGLPMAFKGGTSLSKVFNAIDRFSEDIDITIDFKALGAGFDPFAVGVSRTKLAAFGESLKARVVDHAREKVVPHIERALKKRIPEGTVRAVAEADGQTVRVHYPTALDAGPGYVDDSVLLEFGGRNTAEPREVHEVLPYLAQEVPSLSFPSARFAVLSPVRSFWEKATLLHSECNKGVTDARAQRLARHWYDLYMLADNRIGRDAVGDRAMLADVVRHKKAFFHSSRARYDDCGAGRMKLIPDKPSLEELRKDYAEMTKAGMFYTEPPKFDDIVARLVKLEREINGAAGTARR